MKKIFTPILLILFTVATQAQKKSDLLYEISQLKSELDSLKNELVISKKNEKVSLTKATSFENQVTELQDANKVMMQNLTSFAEVSNKNSENINRAMASLQEKESQLKNIHDALAKNDSTSVVVLTNAKQTLGENSNIGVANGEIIIAANTTSLFTDDKKTAISDAGKIWIQKIANILTINPGTALTIEGLSNTGELDLAAAQATLISSVLQKDFAIDASRISVIGKDGNFKEGINLKIHPQYPQFYGLVKESMKNVSH